ncbi:hypothetical protein C8R43DRAFT_1241439 [Mycena crocata]|nr:hypothetical protein C8R43DRAFT_1241439 [Mycena crocata]
MFASVYDVFEKNPELIGGTTTERENARHLMRKMVNSMSAKLEIGSPMASMYILGNPDHYASHEYVPFAWRPFVQFIRSFWVAHLDIGDRDDDEQNDDEERIPIGRQGSNFVPSTKVDDYRYRPVVYNNVTLYEWIQCSQKKKRNLQELAEFEEEVRMAKYLNIEFHSAAMKRLEEDGLDLDEVDEDNLEDEFDYEEAGFGEIDRDEELIGSADARDDVSDWETDDEDDIIINKHTRIQKARKPVQHAFLPGHGLFPSHSVSCDFERLARVIPNFIGGAVPRSDKGDRAAYCMTMPTLFKPWREPSDLKDPLSTWDQAFKDHQFTERQTELLRNFDVRYECNDARDDHYAQMQKKLNAAKKSGANGFPPGFVSYKDKFADDVNDFDYGSDDENMPDDVDDGPKGRRTLQMIRESKDIRNIMETSGWLDAAEGQLTHVDSEPVQVPSRSRAEWVNIVKHQRQELTSNKLSNMPTTSDKDQQYVVQNEQMWILWPMLI